MLREKRIEIIKKIARGPLISGLFGKIQRKEIEKYLSRSKSVYSQASKELDSLESQISILQKKAEASRTAKSSAMQDMKQCHNIIATMDIIDSDMVDIRKNGDIYYSKNGKWHSYNDDNGLVARTRRTAEEEVEQELIEEEDTLDIDFEGAEVHL